MDITNILQASVSNVQQERDNALRFLEETSQNNWDVLLVTLSNYVANSSNPVLLRTASGIHFKNCLSSKNKNVYKNICVRWMVLPVELRQNIKQNLLRALNEVTVKSTFISQCIASIVAIEFPQKEWFDLLQLFLAAINNENTSVVVKFSVLECVDFICQDLASYILEPVSGQMFDIIITAINKYPECSEINLYSMKAMLSAVKFASKEFSNVEHRNHLMEVICKATQSTNMEISVCAMQALVRIVSLYYHVLENYMNALFQITMAAIKSKCDDLELQGIEFWSTLCDEEVELNEAVKNKEIQQINGSKLYAMGSLEYLLPLLFEKIVEEDANIDDDDWRPSKAAGVCIMLLAVNVGNPIVSYVMNFVSQNITSPQWERRNASLLAFGSVLHGPDPAIFMPTIMTIIPTILQLMNDQVSSVCDSAAWVLGRVFEYIPCVARNQNDADILSAALLKGISMSHNIASNCCWAISIYMRSIYEYQQRVNRSAQEADGVVSTVADERPQTSLISKTFDLFAKAIFDTIDRPDVNMSSLRTMSFDALMSLIKYHPKDRYASVENIIGLIIQRLNRILSMKGQIQSPDEMMQFSEILSLICACLQVAFNVLSSDSLIPALEQTLPLFLDMLQSAKSSSVEEDVLLTLSTIVSVLDSQIIPYVNKIMPLISPGMLMLNEIEVCVATINLIGDIARTVSIGFEPYAERFLSTALTIINTPDVSYKILASVFHTTGDIAFALGPKFELYAAPVLTCALQAYSIPFIEVDDFDLIDDLNYVREACLQVYIMTIQGTYVEIKKKLGDVSSLTKLIASLVNGVRHTISDPNCSEKFINLVCGFYGDLVLLYGKNLSGIIEVNPVVTFLREQANPSSNSSSQSSACWAYDRFRENQLVS